MSRITQCAASLIGAKNIRLNSRVDHIAYLEDGSVELSTQGFHQTFTSAFDAVVVATPPSALHSIVDRPQWSFMKEQSIRGAHYEPLYKIGLHFRTRFWERLTEKPCFGGQSTTDLRFRWIVFPSNGLGSNCSGVLLLYSWMSDAAKWAGLSRSDRIKICLHDLSKYFADEPEIDVYEQFIEAFDVMWTAESCGGDAMFLPGQFSRFFEVAKKREGKIYFAGEHLSKHHTWVSFRTPCFSSTLTSTDKEQIAGAVDSSLQTTAELLDRPTQGEPSRNLKDVGPANPVPALGREFLTLDDQRRAQRTDISSSRFKACMIPKHMNVQYVEVF